ncbi:MAG: hypothetical protein ACLPKE_08035, partial [Streptosporangiaceae bacterium]
MPGYMARVAEAGRPGGTAALRPPRSLFAPGGVPPLTGEETRPQPPAPAAAAFPAGAAPAVRGGEPVPPGASGPRAARGPVLEPDTNGGAGGGAGSADAGPESGGLAGAVTIPGPARPAGLPPRPDGGYPHPAAAGTSAAATAGRAPRPTR